MIYREFYFKSAKPVYEAGCDRELNHAIKLEARLANMMISTLSSQDIPAIRFL